MARPRWGNPDRPVNNGHIHGPVATTTTAGGRRMSPSSVVIPSTRSRALNPQRGSSLRLIHHAEFRAQGQEIIGYCGAVAIALIRFVGGQLDVIDCPVPAPVP